MGAGLAQPRHAPRVGTERRAHLGGGAEAAARRERERAVHDRREIGGHAGRDARERLDLPAAHRRGDRDGIGACDRASPRAHLVEHGADGVEVGARVDLVGGGDLLGRHVRGRAHDDAGAREARLAGRAQLGDAEVEQLHERPARGRHEEDVVGLEIAVHDAGVVRGLEALEHLLRAGGRGRRRERPHAREELRERLADQQLHDEVREAVGRLIDVGHVHDVRRRDVRRQPRLLQEPRDEPGAARELGVQELERDPRPEELVARLPHGAHAPLADAAHQPELRAYELPRLGNHEYGLP